MSALLAAAGELDDEDRVMGAGSDDRYWRPWPTPGLLASSVSCWRCAGVNVDLAGGHLHTRASKTEAGVRSIDVQPELRAELVGLRKLCADPEPDDLVFGTRTGKADSRNNVRRRVLLRAVERANEKIAKASGERLPTVVVSGTRSGARSRRGWLPRARILPTSWHSSGTRTRR